MLNSINYLINAILASYFHHENCVFLVSDGPVFLSPFRIPVVIISIPTASDTLDNYAIFNTSQIINFSHNCQGFIVSAKNASYALDMIETEMYIDKKSFYKYNNRKYVFIMDEKDTNLSDVLRGIHCKNVPDVIFIVEAKDAENLTTYNYEIFTQSCGGENYHKQIFLDRWFSYNNSFMFGRNLFLDKIDNLQRKVIKISGFTYNPYVILGTNYSDSFGIDIRLVQEYIKRHNATPILKFDPSGIWGVQFDEKSIPTGLLAELVYNDVDIALSGYIYIYYSYHYLDFTKPHHNSRLRALVPKPKMLSEVPLALYIFPMQGWIFIAFLYILTTIVLFTAVISPKYKNSKPKNKLVLGKAMLNVFGIYLQQSDHFHRTSRNYKSVIIWAFTMSLFISIACNSRMSSLMTLPKYEKPISMLDDLIRSNVKIGTINLKDVLLLLVNSKRKIDQQVLDHFVEYNMTALKKVTSDGDVGTVTEKTNYLNFAINGVTKKGLSKLQIMRESLCYYHLLLCTKKNFPLLDSFNKLVGRVVESGLVKFWENEAIFFNSSIAFQNIIRYSTHRDVVLRKLKIEQVAGALIIFFCGILISLTAFVYELSISKSM